MNSHQPGLEQLQERVVKLEQQNRRFKRLGMAARIAPAILLLLGQAPSKKTVEANEFVLRDDGGNVRARLFMTKETTTTAKQLLGIDDLTPVTIPPAATLALYDSAGNIRAMLNDNDIAFESAEGHLGGQLGNGTLMLASANNSFALLSPYNLNLQDSGRVFATLGVTNYCDTEDGRNT